MHSTSPSLREPVFIGGPAQLSLRYSFHVVEHEPPEIPQLHVKGQKRVSETEL